MRKSFVPQLRGFGRGLLDLCTENDGLNGRCCECDVLLWRKKKVCDVVFDVSGLLSVSCRSFFCGFCRRLTLTRGDNSSGED